MADFSFGNIIDSVGGGIGAALRQDGSQSNAMMRRSANVAEDTAKGHTKEENKFLEENYGADVKAKSMERLEKAEEYNRYRLSLDDDALVKQGQLNEQEGGEFNTSVPKGVDVMLGYDKTLQEKTEIMNLAEAETAIRYREDMKRSGEQRFKPPSEYKEEDDERNLYTKIKMGLQNTTQEVKNYIQFGNDAS